LAIFTTAIYLRFVLKQLAGKSQNDANKMLKSIQHTLKQVHSIATMDISHLQGVHLGHTLLTTANLYKQMR